MRVSNNSYSSSNSKKIYSAENILHQKSLSRRENLREMLCTYSVWKFCGHIERAPSKLISLFEHNIKKSVLFSKSTLFSALSVRHMGRMDTFCETEVIVIHSSNAGTKEKIVEFTNRG